MKLMYGLILEAASMPYLLEDSTLIYPYRVQNVSVNSGGVGGGISKYSWEGELLWNMKLPIIHTSITMMLSRFHGNILVIVWERKTASEAYAVGDSQLIIH